MAHKTTTVDIKRPEGHIETVDVSDKFPQGLTDPMFETIKQKTMAAGRGEPLSYNVESHISDAELAKIKEHDRKVEWFERHGFNESDVR